MAHVHYGPAVALNEDGIMPSMSQLADLAAGLIQHMKLDEAWEANNNLQAEIKDLCKKLGEAPHSSVASIPSDEQFACDFETLPAKHLPFEGEGADSKGKQKQPLPPQVEPACPPMEDKITPGNLYTDIPMTINKPIIQGTMFPNFDRTELSTHTEYFTLDMAMMASGSLMGEGHDGPIILYNTTEEIHKLMEATHLGLPKSMSEKRGTQRQEESVLNAGKGGWTLQIQNYCGHSSISKTAFGCAALYSHHSVPQCHSCRGTEIYHATPHHVMAQPSGGSAPIKDQYRALLEWAEVAPANGTPVPWEGVFTCLATMADVSTYLAANGIMYHDTDNALKWWAWRAGNEYVAQIISNGGDKDPNTPRQSLIR
ncbi:hypothetical protein EDC04DRAFT_2607757 [Pisolithus marmoratus]|nr:hypothetical protein EDC04DRAFT_2607757 [Pisolithus marmoratus]